MTVEQLNVIVSANKADFDKKINEINKQLGAMSNNAASASSETLSSFKSLASGLAALGIGTMISKAIDLAGDLEQNIGGSESVFKNYAAVVQQSASTAASSLGLSESKYLATANKMGALFQGSGFSIAKSADMTTQAMQRASDVASIMGIEVESAMEAVAGMAKGNFTMMDNLGVAINDTNLQLYAQEKGLGKLETTQQKVNAAMQMFIDKTDYAAGNYERENDTYSGALTTLKAEFENFAAEAGTALLPLAQSVLPVISSALEALKPVVITVAQVLGGLGGVVERIAGLFGVTFQKSTESIEESVNAFEEENESAQNVAGGVDSAAKSVDNLTDSVKRATAGFDEINKLGSSSSTLGSAIVSGEDVENAEKLSSAFNDLQSQLNDTDFDAGFSAVFDALYDGVKAVWGWLTNDVFSFGVDIFTAIFGSGEDKYKALQRLVEKIKALFGEDFISFWTDVGADINTIFNGTEEERYKALEDLDSNFKEFFGEFGEDWSAFWQDIGKGFFELINGDLSSGLQTINDKFEALFGDLGKWWSQTFQGIGAGLYELSHSGEIDMIQLSSKYSTLYSDMMAQIVEDLRNGVSAAEALQNAKNKYLDTSEKLYFFNNDNNNIFTEENLKKWEDNVKNRSADLALSVDTPALPATPEAIDEFFRKIKGYASGGFPDYGDIFIANERGPEMVGTIGGRTAIVNNSQIETAIENAIARGFAKAGNGQPVEIHVYTELDGEIIGESVTEYQSNRTRRDNGYKK